MRVTQNIQFLVYLHPHKNEDVNILPQQQQQPYNQHYNSCILL